jgi:hypothetical protein
LKWLLTGCFLPPCIPVAGEQDEDGTLHVDATILPTSAPAPQSANTAPEPPAPMTFPPPPKRTAAMAEDGTRTNEDVDTRLESGASGSMGSTSTGIGWHGATGERRRLIAPKVRGGPTKMGSTQASGTMLKSAGSWSKDQLGGRPKMLKPNVSWNKIGAPIGHPESHSSS